MASSARIEELKKKFDENPRRYFAPLANEYRKAGDLEAAIAICRTHLPQQPGHMSGHIVFGQTLFEAGKLEEAQAIFQTALELDPENLIALRHLGDIARGLGDDASARSWYTRVLEADPRNEEISSLLASLGAVPGQRPSTTSELTPPEAETAATSLGGSGTQVLDVGSWAGELAEPDERPPASEAGSAPIEELPESTDSWAIPADDVRTDEREPSAEAEVESGELLDLDLPEAAAGPERTSPPQRVSGESILPPPPDASGVEHLPGFEATEFQAPASADAPGTLAGLEGMADWATADTPAVTPPSAAERAARAQADPEDDALSAPSFEFQAPDAAPLQLPPPPAPAPEPQPAGSAAAETPVAAGVFATETMAELLLSQGHRQQAIGIYRQLVEQRPRDEGVRQRLAELEATGGPSIRQFLGTLANWRPGHSGVDPMAAAEGAGEADPAGDEASQGEPLPWLEPPGAYAAEGERSAETLAGEAPLEVEFTPDAAALARGEQPQSGPPQPISTRSSGAFVVDESYVPPDAHRSRPAVPESASATESGGAGEVAELPAPHVETSANGARASDVPAASRGGSIDRLFGGAQPSERDVRAAHALAAAFSTAPTTPMPGADDEGAIRGEPARRASSELSLDQIFRPGGSTAKPAESRSAFSFDQFFGSPGSSSAPPERQEPEKSAADSDDIQHFNSWLQGLKKR